jgi:biopolymer transport protein ExbB
MESAFTFIGESDWVVRTFIATSVIMLTLILEKSYELWRTARELKGVERYHDAPLRPASPLRKLLEAAPEEARVMELQLDLFEQRLRRYLTLLGLVAVLAPMLGLIGTFLGVFEVFEGVSSVGLSDPKVIAGGIRKVLVDTVAGLGIAIPAMAAFKGFEVWVLSLTLRSEAVLYALREKQSAAA